MIPFKTTNLPTSVSPEVMEDIYKTIQTPIKHGAVMKMENDFTDSPTVFRRDGMFYMYFISISKDTSVSGYETHMAKSADLVNWEYCGTIFRRNDLNRWDSKQCAGYAAYPDIRWDSAGELQQVAGAYHISYLAGNSDGYEPDPLYMGLARSEDPTNPQGFVRFPEPILRPEDEDSRPFEDRTLYKSFMFCDPALTTGYPYVNVYNAKGQDSKERIFLAVSEDGEHFERYGHRAVLDLSQAPHPAIITGDPQIIRIGDVYVMLFFRLDHNLKAYDTFACSYDLANWTVWEGEPLVSSVEEWENTYAHKPWFIRYEGVNYPFYCAVNSKGERFIAMAHS
jgi:predicted GH43/DUF377 family glycosyl hydrolase